jgi:hypothetical protein
LTVMLLMGIAVSCCLPTIDAHTDTRSAGLQ